MSVQIHTENRDAIESTIQRWAALGEGGEGRGTGRRLPRPPVDTERFIFNIFNRGQFYVN